VLGKPSEPSPISDVNSASYAAIERTAFEIAADPGTLVAPFLVLGATDSRHFAPLADNVFRFSPVHFVPEDLNRMHGTNERIRVAEYRRAVQFYVQFIRNMCSG
jgi:carboxypeptidase PM20D1